MIIAIQKLGKKGVSRAYAMKINNAGTKQLRPFLIDSLQKMH